MKKKHAAAVFALVVVAFVVGRYSRAGHHDQASAVTPTRHILYYVDPMHPSYHSSKPGIAPDCGMQLEAVYASDSGVTTQSTALTGMPEAGVTIEPAIQRAVGIEVASVQKSSAPQLIRVLGHVVPEDTMVYRVDSGSEGFIRDTYNDSVGTLVKKDQKLASCYGPEYLSIASGFLAANAGVPGSAGKDGSRTMPFPGALSKQGVSSIRGYTDRLRNLGMSEAQIRQMADTHQLPESVDIVSPANGFILARNITPGQHFDRATEFYRVADLNRVWILADVFESEAAQIHPGAVARVKLRDGRKTLTARVTNILPQLDPATRTMKLRLEAENPGFALRPEMFVDVELPVSVPAGLTVPADAVIQSGHEQVVFVERGDGSFEPRRVQTGWHADDRVEIVHGLSEGERVVSEGTFLVDSESRLKLRDQGSVDIHHHDSAPGQNTAPTATTSADAVKTTMPGDHYLAANSSRRRP